MEGKMSEQINFSKELNDYIAEWKDKPGNLIMILHRVQEEFGYIPRKAALKITEMIDVTLAKIYGVITFYHYFKLTKPGKHQIQICMGTACYLKGGQDLIDELETNHNIPINGSSSDGNFSLEALRCVGCCGLAPVMIIDGEVYGKITNKEIKGILAKYK
jgi:NADH-quinone oxidoreductase subunit E